MREEEDEGSERDIDVFGIEEHSLDIDEDDNEDEEEEDENDANGSKEEEGAKHSLLL